MATTLFNFQLDLLSLKQTNYVRVLAKLTCGVEFILKVIEGGLVPM